MTNQTLINNPSNRVAGTSAAVQNPHPVSDSVASNYGSRLLAAMKSQYQLDQQMKFLDLQAEAETLLQQLQAIQQQRQASDNQIPN